MSVKSIIKNTPPYRLASTIAFHILNWLDYNVTFPAIYIRAAKKKRVNKSKAVFIEPRVDYLSDNYSSIYQKMEKAGYNVTICYLQNTVGNRIQRFKRNISMLREIADARYVFINDGCRPLSSIKPRKGTIITQTWHACGAFKKFGFSTADLIFGGSRKQQEKYPTHRNYNLATVSSKEVIWAYEEAFGYEDKPGVVRAIGTPRTDVFFDKGFLNNCKENVKKFFPESEGKKIILYAPTFRGRVKTAETPTEFDIGAFAEKFSDDYVLLIRHHFLVKDIPEIPEEYAHFAKDCTKDLTIEDCLVAADICITDYSSLVFEYSLFERPMLFFSFDRDDYDDWRGFYYDYEEFTPGPICTTNEEMIEYIADIENRFDKEEVIAFRKKFMGACDGHATERLLKRLTGRVL